MAVKEIEPEPVAEPRKPGRRRWWRRLLKGLAAVLLVVVVIVAVVLLVQYARLRSRLAEPLPVSNGELRLAGLSAPVRVERDALGVPTFRAANRLDLARALGYVHAQERFFQMDLVLRRRGAGELSELIGPPAKSWDVARRPFRFRAVARRILMELPLDQRALLDAYTAGVNAGLSALPDPPFEYVVLAQKPEPWRAEDSVLAILTMFSNLEDYTHQYEVQLGMMKELLPPALSEFMNPQWTEWEAPMEGGPLPILPVPGPDQVNLRKLPRTQTAAFEPGPHGELGNTNQRILGGSSSWAVDGRHTASGHAILANDVHLQISVPNLWYRASFVWRGEDGAENRVTGVTLPGLPLMVVGSNRHVAWGFTSSLVDASDIVVLDVDPKDPEVYRTPEGPKRFEHHAEMVKVHFGIDDSVDVRWTIWGPVIGKDQKGRPLALRWIAYEPGGVNIFSYRLEAAKTLDQALDIANRGGAPPRTSSLPTRPVGSPGPSSGVSPSASVLTAVSRAPGPMGHAAGKACCLPRRYRGSSILLPAASGTATMCRSPMRSWPSSGTAATALAPAGARSGTTCSPSARPPSATCWRSSSTTGRCC